MHNRIILLLSSPKRVEASRYIQFGADGVSRQAQVRAASDRCCPNSMAALRACPQIGDDAATIGLAANIASVNLFTDI